MRLIPTCALLAACSGGTDDSVGTTGDTGPVIALPTGDTAPGTTPEPTGACGEVTYHDVTVRGIVWNEQGYPAPFATVTLEDRGWMPVTEMGTGTTDATGVFDFVVPNLVSVEDCWGTILDYVMVAELGPQRGEDEINTWLFSAIENGSLVADMSSTPIQMEDTSATK